MKLWENTEIGICLAAMVLMMLITFVQVICRYGFGFSFSWAEEVCRILLVWVTFGGSAYAFKVGAHIGVEAIVNVLPPKIKLVVVCLSRLITLIFFVIVAYYGTIFTMNQLAIGQLTPALRMPVAVGYIAVPIGSVLVLLRLLYMYYIDLMENLRKGVQQH